MFTGCINGSTNKTGVIMIYEYEVQIELPDGNGDYDDVIYEDINVNFECELIGAQVGVDRDYLEIVGFELPEEYKDNASVRSQVDSCLDWVGDKLNEEYL